MEINDKVANLTLELAEIMLKNVEGLDEKEAFKILSNTSLRLATYPMIYIGMDKQDEYVRKFEVAFRKLAKEWLRFQGHNETRK